MHTNLDEASLTTIKSYDYIAPAFTKRWFGYLMQKELNTFVSHLQGPRVLDVGCGPARDSKQFRIRGLNPVAVDLSVGMLLEAKKRVQLPLVQMDMRALGFRNRSFDGVWACASIMHVPKAQTSTVLAELNRVLVGSGHIYVTTRKGDGERFVTGEYPNCCRFYSFFSADELRERILSIGFDILSEHESLDPRGIALLHVFAQKPP